MPTYGSPGGPSGKSQTGPIVAAVGAVVFVAIIGLVSTIAVTSHHGSSVAEKGNTPEHQPAPYPSSTHEYPTTTSSSAATTTTTTTHNESSTSHGSSTYVPGTKKTRETASGPAPVYELADNPLFASKRYGLQNIACALPRWEMNPAAAERFFRGAQKCLDESWTELLDAVDLPSRAPSLRFPSGTSWPSPCGTVDSSEAVAFYCGENETIYMPYEGLQADQYRAHPGVYLAIFAHEYGHHVQYLSGIWDTYQDARQEAGEDSAKGLELSRRAELQAQCFSGMFLGSTVNEGGDINQQIYDEAWDTQDRGDENGNGPRDHGNNNHTSGWWQQGATENRTYQCNTWSIDSSEVS